MKITAGSIPRRQLSQLVLVFALSLAGQNLLGNDYDAFLVARYNFEDTNNPYADSSGNNNNPDSFTSGSQPDTFSTDAAVGQYARLYFGDTSFSFTQSNPAYQSLSNALSGNFSLTAWVKTTNSVSGDYSDAYYGAAVFFAGADYNNHCTIPLSITGGKAAFTIVSQDGPGTVTLHSMTSVNDGNYHCLAVTRQQSSGLMSVYVDGNLEATGTGITDPVITQGYISVAGGYNFYSGLLDDVRVYSTNLSAGDVASISSGGNVITLATAVGATNLNVTSSGDTSWFVEATNTYNGAPYADQSGSVTNSQSSTLSMTVTGPGTLAFYWSSIANDTNKAFDYEFDIDGNYADDIDGDVSWHLELNPTNGLPYSIPAGQHTLTWTAYAYGDTDPTQAGYLDDVSYVPAAAPSLTITASPTNGPAPLTVQFTSPTMDSFGDTVTNWIWNFGDGGNSTAQSPSHIYTNAGSFSPSLTAYSTFGASPLSVVGPGTITVTEVTLNVSVTPPYGVAPLTVQFASPGVDSGGNTVTNWNWSFGDGGSSTAQNPSHVYTTIGNFSPNLVVQSTHGTSALAVTGLGGINVYANPTPAFHTLYTFSTNFGAGPNGGLALSGNTLYGTTTHGGISGFGAVFAINTDGTGFSNLFNNFNSSYTNGVEPAGGVIFSGGTLFGTTYGGGDQGGGTVFAISTNGMGFTNLLLFDVGFTPGSGSEPQATVVLYANTLYGTTWYGGADNHGALFWVTTDGANNGLLHSFTTPYYNPDSQPINYDGLYPSANLICSDGTLYGTTEQAGNFGGGTIFSVVTNQPGSFSVLHYFSAADPVTGTNGDGAYSFSGLVLSGSNLYGTTAGGGIYGNGTVFAVNKTTLVFSNLHNFTGGGDGSAPRGGLTLSGNTLYGTTTSGGIYTNGTLFAINTDGSGFTNLYSFTGGADGADPQGDLLLSGNTLYGAAGAGSVANYGIIFSFTLPSSIVSSTITIGNLVRLGGGAFQFNWTNTPGSSNDVLFSTNVAIPLTNWTVLGAATEISSGYYQFTDPQATNGPCRFYRVRSP